MVIKYLKGPDRFYQFPFWAGVIALGWFFPQAIGGYYSISVFPGSSYLKAMFFASICTLALWYGYESSFKKKIRRKSWLMKPLSWNRLYYAGVILALFGFFFYWKLWQLPEDELARQQWTGETVKYLFLAGTFHFGVLALWLRYLNQNKIFNIKSLVFIIPGFLFILSAALLRGRRTEMMNFFSLIVFGLYFVRNIKIPRKVVITLLIFGFILLNGIGIYRSTMMDENIKLEERISLVTKGNYIDSFKLLLMNSGNEFKNYVYRFQAHSDMFYYDFGGYHWNRFVFNYVPAQIVGTSVKESLMFPLKDMTKYQDKLYGFTYLTGSTGTGYIDSFGSFGWFGFIKFFLIGGLMGYFFRYAITGAFLAQMLYIYLLPVGMYSITHGTNEILVRVWIYFFILIFPMFYWAQSKKLIVKSF